MLRRFTLAVLMLGAYAAAVPANAQQSRYRDYRYLDRSAPERVRPERRAPEPQPAADDPRPTPPVGMAATFVPPERDANGVYRTPNSNLSTDETTWHVRAALNMAALACRDVNEQEIVARYNLMLARERGPLAAAVAGMAAEFRARYGARAQQQHDKAMTELYNFFALATAHNDFCPVALDLLREGSEIEPDQFAGFARYALPKLEAPFLQAFAAYDDYRSQLAEWKSQHGPRVVMAASGSQPVAGGYDNGPPDDAVETEDDAKGGEE